MRVSNLVVNSRAMIRQLHTTLMDPLLGSALRCCGRVRIQQIFQTVCNSCVSARYRHQYALQQLENSEDRYWTSVPCSCVSHQTSSNVTQRHCSIANNTNINKDSNYAKLPASKNDVLDTYSHSTIVAIPNALGRPRLAQNDTMNNGTQLENATLKTKGYSNERQRKATGAPKKRAATSEQLMQMKAQLERILPSMLRNGTPYELFDENVLVEDRFSTRLRPQARIGLGALGWTSAKYRCLVYARYTQAKLHILRIGVDEKESRLTIRWRVVGYTIWGKHSLLRRARKQANFLAEAANIINEHRAKKTLPDEASVRKAVRQGMLSFQDPSDPDSAWIDGLFEIYVNGNGRIARVRIDRVDENRYGAKETAPNAILVALGLAPKPQTMCSSPSFSLFDVASRISSAIRRVELPSLPGSRHQT